MLTRVTDKKLLEDGNGNCVLNAYWEGLVADDPYVKGYIEASKDIYNIIWGRDQNFVEYDQIEEIYNRIKRQKNSVIVKAIESLSNEEIKAKYEEMLNSLTSEEKRKIRSFHSGKLFGTAVEEI